MATIYVDGKEYDVTGANNLLQTCLSLGLNIPYFCWHPAMGSVGSCRQCAVKVYKDKDDKRGTLVMACMTGIKDKTYISIEDEEAVAFRKSVVEWLMANHPHDCPVCSEGGQCHLQDMVMMVGHSHRRYRFSKRTHITQDLGPCIDHEMNRCISCYRCVRYYRDYAGGSDFGVFGSHDHIYFGRETEGTLESEFSGNLTEVCPTGVFTDKTYNNRFARKWDLQYAPSICQGCSIGCTISVGERYGTLRRIENRYNGTINKYFLCDRGRFGHEYVNCEDRPRQYWSKNSNFLKQSLSHLLDGKRVMGIGSPSASIESNHAIRRLVGEGNISSGVEAKEWQRLCFMLDMKRRSPLPSASLKEIEECDVVVVLGEDITQTAARMALSVRQAARKGREKRAAELGIPVWHSRAVDDAAQHIKNPIFLASVSETKLDDISERCFYGTVKNVAQLGAALAYELDPKAAFVESPDKEWVRKVAEALRQAKKPLIISGEALLSLSVLQAAANIAIALKKLGKEGHLTLVPREVNSFGVAMIGGVDLNKALRSCTQGNVDTLIVVENDLFSRMPLSLVNKALAGIKTLIVIDHQRTALSEKADYILPAASFAETGGTVVNYEGRAQRFYAAYDPKFLRPDDHIQASWQWLCELNKKPFWSHQLEIIDECAATYRSMEDLVLLKDQEGGLLNKQLSARQSHRSSGRTALRAKIDIREQSQSSDPDSQLSFSMDGYSGTESTRKEIPFAWVPGISSPQAWIHFQDEFGTSLKFGDPGILLSGLDDKISSYFYNVIGEDSPDKYTTVPLYHLFGSDMMSSRSESIQKRSPRPYILLSCDDKSLRDNNDVWIIETNDCFIKLPIKYSKYLKAGVVGVPIGMEGMWHTMIHSDFLMKRESQQ